MSENVADAVLVRVAAYGEAGQLAVSVKTAARITDLSTAFIYTAMNKQQLPAYRVGRVIRILVADLEAWLTQVRYQSEDDV